MGSCEPRRTLTASWGQLELQRVLPRTMDLGKILQAARGDMGWGGGQVWRPVTWVPSIWREGGWGVSTRVVRRGQAPQTFESRTKD